MSYRSYSPLLYSTLLYSTLLYSTILYYTILYYTILYYTMLYYTILYYTILYYTILYYTILYYTILYYTILYYTILYYTILYCTWTLWEGWMADMPATFNSPKQERSRGSYREPGAWHGLPGTRTHPKAPCSSIPKGPKYLTIGYLGFLY